MTRVYLADALPDERSAMRLLLLDLMMEVVGEADDLPTTLAYAPTTRLDMLVMSWELIPIDLREQTLAKLRMACSNTIAVVMISHLNIRQQAAISADVDAFISRSDTPDLVSTHLRLAAARVHSI